MQLSGQTTVTTAGTAVVLGDEVVNSVLIVKALPGNAGYVYVGNDGEDDVSSLTGFPLDAGDVMIFREVGNLSSIHVDSAEDGDKVAWIIGGTL